MAPIPGIQPVWAPQSEVVGMNRRHLLAFAAATAATWIGWKTLVVAEPPALLPQCGSACTVPTPVACPDVKREPVGPRQEPSVRVEWCGPGSVRVGQPNDYTLCVRNLFQYPVDDVVVKTRGPVLSADPKPNDQDGILCWELGRLEPKQEKQIQVRIVVPNKGEAIYPASVTFTSQACLRLKASEPSLGIGMSTSSRCNIDDGTACQVTVQNTGDGPAEQVRLRVEMPNGIEHVRGRKLDFELGTIHPGESRDVQVLGVARMGGEQTIKASACADGVPATQGQVSVAVVAPRLDVAVNGPQLRYLDRKAIYTVKVSNPGDASAANVMLHDVLPAGFRFVAANQGGRFDNATRTVSWFVGEIAPGQTKEVAVELQAQNAGQFQHRVSAVAARGLQAEATYPTNVEGLSAIQVEVVDTQDPVEVGGETVYVVRVMNTGSQTETDLRLACTVPDKLELLKVAGPTTATQHGSEVVFEVLPQLAPRMEAVYKITVRALSPGVAHFKTQLTSSLLKEPVQKVEPTRVYSD